MDQAKKNILIIEDIEGQYTRIRDRLLDVLGDRINVVPVKVDEEESIDSFHYVMELAKGKHFDLLLKKCPDIDIFVIDNSLLSSDHTGCELRDHIVKTNYRGGNYFLLLVSSTAKSNLTISKWDDLREKYVTKIKYNKHVQEAVLDEVMTVMNLKESGELPTDTVLKGKVITPTYNSYLKRKSDDQQDEFARSIIDRMITWIFFILLAVTSLSAAFNITLNFTQNATKSWYQSNFNPSNRKTEGPNISQNAQSLIHPLEAKDKPNVKPLFVPDLTNEEDGILKTVEQIYLYLLPIFIVFGFYNYYVSNRRLAFLDANDRTIDIERSTKTMRLTKILFISSMIAYVVIKTIEILFATEPNLPKLAGAGILILILMGYFVFLERLDKEDQTIE